MEKRSWAHNAVVYQIYPLSFKDGNGDGKGDLPGIISKLDYLKDLGIDAIWLSPIYQSPMADFGYDISNHTAIDPIFGTMEDFDSLVAACHERDIKIMLDFVPNHTSNLHPWFLESASAADSPKRDWYLWADGKGEEPPNNWLSVFGGSGWQLDKKTGQYYFHSFLKEQPDLNYRNPEVVRAMEEILTFWLERGVDGFRIDAAYHIMKDESLRDNPPNSFYEPGSHDPYFAQINAYSHGLSETFAVIKSWCQVLTRFGDKFMVTEVHAGFEKMVDLYKICDAGHHSPFNFNLISMPWSAEEFKKFIDDFESHLRPQDLPNYVLGNHDKPRVVSRLGQQRARALAMMEMTLRGMAFVYYGEEIGMDDTTIPADEVLDPFEKNVPGFALGRDGCRTPMQWDGQPNAGFTKGHPWLRVNQNYLEVNVRAEQKNPLSMLSLYRQLIAMRKTSPAIISGSYKSLNLDGRVFSYMRVGQEEEFLVLLNFSEQSVTLPLPFEQGKILLNTWLTQNETFFDRGILTLAGYEGMVIKKTS